LSDRPDFTLPVSIEGYTIEVLPIDIKAASLGVLQVNANIASQTVTLETRVENFPSEFPLPSAQVSELKNITIQNVAAGLIIDVNIKNASVTVNVENFPSEFPLPADQVSSLQQITIQNVAAGLYIPINIAKADATVNANATIAGVVAGVYVPITIHSVESGVVFEVSITNVAAGVTFNVNITNPVVKTGMAKPALSFDGVNDYVEVPHPSGMNTDMVTIAVWLRIRKLPTAYSSAPAYISGQYWLEYYYNKDLVFCMYDDSGRYHEVRTNVDLREFFHLIIGTFDNNTMKIYVDGVLKSSNTIGAVGIITTTNPFRIGNPWSQDHDWVGSPDGLVSQVLIYNRALSDDEIQQLYNNPQSPSTNGLVLWLNFDEGTGNIVYDKSGNGNNGTIYGATWVSAEGSVPATVNVNIVAQSIEVNIKTSSGVNIVIDRLTATAYIEDRRTISNNGATPSMTAPGTIARLGKFFPRGCRGFLYSIEVYCDNPDTVDRRLYVYVSPQPGMQAIYSGEVYVVAGASGAWRSATIRKFWNYDSMFIWVLGETSSYPRIGYDSGSPYDAYQSPDGVAWEPKSYRYWIRVVMTGQTVGDLPVCGTVNAVILPNLTSGRSVAQASIPPAGTYYETILGCGSLLIAFFRVTTTTARDSLCPSILCDDKEALPIKQNFSNWKNWLLGNSLSNIYISVWDTTNNIYTLVVALPLKFRRSLKIGYYNASSSTLAGDVYFTYEMIT